MRCTVNLSMEALAAGQLGFNQIDYFYPTIQVQPVNRRSQKLKPFFPGYLCTRVLLDMLGDLYKSMELHARIIDPIALF